MARLGDALGWPHYSAGWHATCTAGAPAAAAGAAVALGLGPEQIATAMALAVPGAGGVQRAFGTDAKSLQVGFAVDAGIRAATLAAAGAQADPVALEEWMTLVGGDPGAADLLRARRFPAGWRSRSTRAATRCSARSARWQSWPSPGRWTRPRCAGSCSAPRRRTLTPLIHHRPDTGLQGKFSLEYAAAAALLDGYPGFASFTDDAVRGPPPAAWPGWWRSRANRAGPGCWTASWSPSCTRPAAASRRSASSSRPGHPRGPPPPTQLQAKIADCLAGLDCGPGRGEPDPAAWTWPSAADLLRDFC